MSNLKVLTEVKVSSSQPSESRHKASVLFSNGVFVPVFCSYLSQFGQRPFICHQLTGSTAAVPLCKSK